MTIETFTPSQIVQELDRFIVGQQEAKKAVAVALRNRWRRQRVKPESLQNEIVPKNILMIGPTGVGKTEIARRLSKLTGSPFIKVEATKFTEVGYVGRDVESIVRDLMDISVSMFKAKARKEVEEQATKKAEEKILDVIAGINASEETREKFKNKLRNKDLDDKEIEIYIQDNAGHGNSLDVPGVPGTSMGVLNIGDIINKALGSIKTKLRKLTVKEALAIIVQEESEKLIDDDKIVGKAIKLVEDEGIVFLDEIDKITSRSDTRSGEISREGVQRDLLPLIEGTIVNTKYGSIKTDHILFIASGAFHLSKPSDLLPELQGRLPIRVELKALTKEDMVLILKEPETSLVKQYIALIATEGIALTFTDDAIEAIASFASQFNSDIENIGARRLHTIMERILEDISFKCRELENQTIVIDSEFVSKQLTQLSKNSDLARFVL